MNSCTNTNGEEDLVQKVNVENHLNSSNKLYNQEVENLAKEIVLASSKIMLDDYIIETNEQRFKDDLEKGGVFTSEYVTFAEMGEVFQNYFGIDKDATVELFTVIYNNRSLISKIDREELQAAIANEAELYNSTVSPGTRLIFGALVSVINPKGCGWGVAAGVVDTALSAAATAIISPTGVGAAIGAVSTAGYYAATVAQAVRCKK
ncbi:hypothetical protein OK18_17045 [Chryseobacterium gallinarum]|uniref:Uncharacterized protein n=2 Tax=Chryseobacterium gallinarum TaxID=1324352 RepID=A0A0G3M5H7_CHRGL|nr:hypothetical protein OK18_17045 [Chryseobacterium gallinarum]